MTDKNMNNHTVATVRLPSFLVSAVVSVLAGWTGVAYAVGANEVPVAAPNFVSSGNANYAVNGAQATVNQASQRAILNWQRFNVGENAALRFVQPSTSAVAVNKIYQADPSRIMGSLQANGQVYLVNPNGIIFGDGATVNVGALVASTLGVRDEIVNEVGLLNAVKNGEAAFEAGAGLDDYKALVGSELPDGMAVVRIEPRANITADPNGFVLVIAPSVVNEGTISTPDGQTILAASDNKVYLAEPGDFDDARLVGMLIEVDQNTLSASKRQAFVNQHGVEPGAAVNSGEITAERGNVTLMGMAVNQEGIIRATTAVDVGGSIRLIGQKSRALVANGQVSRYVPEFGGVTVGDDSVTEVLPDLGDLATAIDSLPQTPSRVEVRGKNIAIGDRARLTARSGEIEVLAIGSASGSPNPNQYSVEVLDGSQSGTPPGSTSATGDGVATLTVGDDVVFDASGLTPDDWQAWIAAHPADAALDNPLEFDMSRNVAELKVLGYELRDAPLQRDEQYNKDRILNGETISFDVRNAPDIADTSAVVANRVRTVAERSTTGGRVELKSTGSLQVGDDAVYDVRGGYVSYRDGYLNTTKLRAGDLLFDIADAPDDLIYDGIYSPGDYGDLAENFELGYVEGKDAGSVVLFAYDVDSRAAGQALGGVSQGRYQRSAPDGSGGVARAFDQLPLAGSLTLGRPRALFLAGAGPGAVEIRFDSTTTGAALIADAMAALDVRAAETLTLAAGEALALAAGGDYRFSGVYIDLLGSIRAPGAVVNVETDDPFRGLGRIPVGGHRIVVGSAAGIDVSGAWLNDLDLAGSVLPAVFADAGAIELSTEGDLAMHGSLRANAGGWVDRAGKLRSGAGGDIALGVDYDLQRQALLIDGDLEAYTFGDSRSTLSLKAPGFIVAAGDSAVHAPDAKGRLALGEGWLAQGGFTDVALTATHAGIDVGDGVEVVLMPDVFDLGNPAFVTTGSDLAKVARLIRPPLHAAPATQLSLAAQNSGYSDPGVLIRIGVGALLQVADTPDSAILVDSDTNILVEGRLRARSGRIALHIAPNELDLERPGQAIWLGDSAELDVSASSRTYQLGGQIAGELYDAGEITLRAERGYVVAEPGAVLDLSGLSQVIDLPGGVLVDAALRDDRFAHAAAGSASIETGQGAAFLASVRADTPLGSPLSGGSVALLYDASLSDQRDSQNVSQFPLFEPRAVLGSHVWSTLGFTGSLTPIGAGFQGAALLDPAALAAGGVDTLSVSVLPHRNEVATRAGLVPQSLGAVVAFSGNIDVTFGESLVIDAPTIRSDGGQFTLRSPYVALGSANQRFRVDPAYDPVATAGSGRLSVQAQLVDLVGSLAFQGFGGAGTADNAPILLTADEDVRLRGVRIANKDITDPSVNLAVLGDVSAASSLSLRAGRAIYATTLSEFTLRTSTGTLAFLGSGGTQDPTVFSAASQLVVQAPDILQAGQLFAPFGSISLEAANQLVLAPGSLTSVSGDGLVLPLGSIGEEGAWLLSFGSDALGNRVAEILEQPQQKRIDLDATVVDIQAGAEADISGGGELFASSFVAGPSGSTDLLSSINAAGAFAIVPHYDGRYAAWDPLLSPAFAYDPGTVLEIPAGTAGPLPPGRYTVMPAAYAQLDGAFLVTPADGLAGQVAPGQAVTGLDGVVAVSGRLGNAGSGAHSIDWQTFTVETGEQFARRAEYQHRDMDTYFRDLAASAGTELPELLSDSGTLVLDATDSLGLAGSLRPSKVAGIAPRVDITGNRIAILDRLTASDDQPGRIELTAGDLRNFGAESVLVGGTRQRIDGVTVIDVSAQDVEVLDNDGGGMSLALVEMFLVGGNTVDVGDGVVLSTTAGALSAAAPQAVALSNAGDAALLALSERELTGFAGFDVGNGAASQLQVDAGARLAANGSATLIAGDAVNQAGMLDLKPGAALFRAEERVLLSAATTVPGSRLSVRSDLVEVADAAVLSFDALSIDARGLISAGGTGQAQINVANALRIGNGSGYAATGLSPGSADLVAQAGEVLIGAGDFGLGGFAQATVLTPQLIGDAPDGGSAGLAASGDLVFGIDNVGIRHGGTLTLAATGDLALDPGAGSLATAGADLGGALNLAGRSVHIDTRISLPSGLLTAAALGSSAGADVRIGSNAVLDLGGRLLPFGTALVGSSGGHVDLLAASGDVSIADGASLTMDGVGAEGHAGALSIAANGQVTIGSGTRLAARADSSDRQAGEVRIVADTLAGGLDGINTLLEAGGFAGSRYLRTRQGDLVLSAGQTATAGRLVLVADNGAIDIHGTIDAATAASGGDVSLRAADRVALHAGSQVLAGAGNAAPVAGRVALEVSDAAGTIAFDGGMDLGGLGVLEITVPRAAGASPLAAITSLGGSLSGAEQVALVGMQHYTTAANGRLNYLYDENQSAVALSLVDRANDQFLTAVGSLATLATGLGLDPAQTLRVLPGVTIANAGDLVIDSGLDLLNWRSGSTAEVGVLRLLAGDDLLVGNGSSKIVLGDGFVAGQRDVLGVPYDRLQQGPSWDIELVGGADLGSADPAATQGSGRVLLKDRAIVRTGTGSIDVSSAGDLVFEGTRSQLYTAGEDAGGGAFATAYGGQDSDSSYNVLFLNLWASGVAFADNGGDLSIDVGGDLIGPSDAQGNGTTAQSVVHWRPRLGATAAQQEAYATNGTLGAAGVPPTAWGIAFDHFEQNIGVLGGGDLQVRVGGDARNIWLNSATSGQPTGNVQMAPGSQGTRLIADSYVVNVLGGGDSTLWVGGDFVGGGLYQEQGSASVRVLGDIGRSAADVGTDGLVLALGDAAIALDAGGDLVLDTVYNPSLVAQADNQTAPGFSGFGFNAAAIRSRFVSYGSDAAIRLGSVAGDVLLRNDVQRIGNLSELTLESAELPLNRGLSQRLYPATLDIVSLGGEIALGNATYLMPSASGNLRLFADGAIRGIDTSDSINNIVIQSDISPSELPGVATPVAELIVLSSSFSDDFFGAGPGHAVQPVFRDNLEPNEIVAVNGDLVDVKMSLAKQSRIQAGGDFDQVWLDIQHSLDARHGEDLTIVQAGGGIGYDFDRDRAGIFNPTSNPDRGISVSGDGQLIVITGDDLNLGDTKGILSTGNTRNSALPEDGADITVLAGLDQAPNYAGFVQTYLADVNNQPQRFDIRIAAPGTLLSRSDVDDLKALFGEDASFWVVGTHNAGDEITATVEYKGDNSSVAVADFAADLQAFAATIAARDKVAVTPSWSAAPYGYRSLARDYVAGLPGQAGVDEAQAVAFLANANDPREHLSFYLDIFNSELVAGGQRAAQESATVFFDRAKLAIDTLFPGAPRAPMQSEQGLAAAAAAGLASGAGLPDPGVVGSVLAAFGNSSFVPLNGDDITAVNVAGEAALDPSTAIAVDPDTGSITETSIDAALARSPYSGDVVSLFSRISPEDGGSLRLFAPGGNYIGGTVLQFEGVQTGAVVPRGGDLTVMAGLDVLVNSSKIVNRSSGGDLAVWSSVGNIDAGRGQRGARVEAASFALDDFGGQRIANDSPIIAGSGIQNSPAGAGEIGNTYLLTELGVINAGTAGIQAESVTLFAAVVQNTESLDLGSVTTSVSLSTGDSAPAAAPDLGASTNASEIAGDPTENLPATGAGSGDDDQQLALLSVEVLGFGDPNSLPATGAGPIDCSDERNRDRAECRG